MGKKLTYKAKYKMVMEQLNTDLEYYRRKIRETRKDLENSDELDRFADELIVRYSYVATYLSCALDEFRERFEDKEEGL